MGQEAEMLGGSDAGNFRSLKGCIILNLQAFEGMYYS
jgi:hypothetical protein